MAEKGEIAQSEKFHIFPQSFCAVCILKPFNSHISVVVCSFFDFGTVSKWCIRNGLRSSTCSQMLALSRDALFCLILLYPRKTNVFRGILESALSVHMSVCVQNTSFCERGRGIKSH